MGQLLGAMMPQTQQQGDQPPDDVPILLKYLAKVVGTVGGAIAVGLGFFTFVSISPLCYVAGAWQVLAGICTVIMESPWCCQFIEFAQPFAAWADQRTYWQKGTLYLILSLPAIFLCFGISTIFGSGLIFVTAVLYGMMALGKKAPREDMINRVASTSDVTLVDNMEAGKFQNRPM